MGSASEPSGRSPRARLAAVIAGVALVAVVLAPNAASWHGLLGAGREVFGLSGGWEFVVPVSLDCAALYCAALSLRAILRGDSAFGARVLTALYAMAGAAFNFYYASAGGNVPAALFFGGASISAVVLWDLTLRDLRRDQLREQGFIDSPLPRFRLLRWLVALPTTARAWRLAIVEQISDPSEALHRARTDQQRARSERRAAKSSRRVEAERVTDTPALPEGSNDQNNQEENRDEQVSAGAGEGRRTAVDGVHDADHRDGGVPADQFAVGRGGGSEHGHRLVSGSGAGAVDVPALDRDLTGLSKAEAVRCAFDALGERDVPAALRWLAERGVTVDRSYAYTVVWSQPAPSLQVVGGAQ